MILQPFTKEVIILHIPEYEIKSLARFFVPLISEFFASEEGQKEYEEWLAQQKSNPTNATEGEYERKWIN